MPDALRELLAAYDAFLSAPGDADARITAIAARAGLHPKALLKAIRKIREGSSGVAFETVDGIAKAIEYEVRIVKKGTTP